MLARKDNLTIVSQILKVGHATAVHFGNITQNGKWRPNQNRKDYKKKKSSKISKSLSLTDTAPHQNEKLASYCEHQSCNSVDGVHGRQDYQAAHNTPLHVQESSQRHRNTHAHPIHRAATAQEQSCTGRSSIANATAQQISDPQNGELHLTLQELQPPTT